MIRAFDDFAPVQLDPYSERFKQGVAPVTSKPRVAGAATLPPQHGFPWICQPNDIFYNIDDAEWYIFIDHKWKLSAKVLTQ